MKRNMPAAKVKPRMPAKGRFVTKDFSQASKTFRKMGIILYLTRCGSPKAAKLMYDKIFLSATERERLSTLRQEEQDQNHRHDVSP